MNDISWKEFIIGETFELINSTAYHKSDVIESGEKNKLPYVTRTSLQNGIEMFVERDSTLNINKGNQIVFGAENADFFYQEHPFITGNKMYLLNHEKMNKPIGLFLVNVLRSAIKGSGFGYSLGMTATRLSNRKVLLPTTANNNPNWQYMEKVGANIFNFQVDIIKNYLIDNYTHIEKVDIPNFSEIEWGEYKIGDLFEFRKRKTKGLNSLEKKPNGISYVGATNRNNGVVEFIESVEDMIYEGNCIVFIKNGEGAMGYSVYKQENFIATQDVSVGYNDKLNKYNGLFITTLADRARGKYNFGYKRNINRLKNEILQLPMKKNKEVDWKYMEIYMKNLMYNQLERLLNHMN